MRTSKEKNSASIEHRENVLLCSGDWTILHLQEAEKASHDLSPPSSKILSIDLTTVNTMDTSGAWLLKRLVRQHQGDGVSLTLVGLNAEAQSLYNHVSELAGDVRVPNKPPPPPFIPSIGRSSLLQFGQAVDLLSFLGEVMLNALRWVRHPFSIRFSSTLRELSVAGHQALPIVGLMSFLMGVVIAYQGGVQLRLYGANIYIADLVGLSMVRELAPLVTAIIVAGRTGSAYTAQIGTMMVTEEIDALRSLAISPIELLVVPKLVALFIALPLLTVFADLMGILGGMVMAGGMLGVSPASFIDRLNDAMTLESYLIGVGKAPVFAGIIVAVGCFQGFLVSGSAESVGQRTTQSVVQAIFLVLLVDALFSVIFSWLGI